MTKQTLSRATAALAALALFAAIAGAKTSGNITITDSDRANSARETLREIKRLALQASDGADEFKRMLDTTKVGPDSERSELNSLKDKINKMGTDVAGLQAERDSLPIWEQHALDKVFPLLKKAADNTKNAIAYFNSNQNHLWSPENGDFVERIAEETEQVASTLDNYLKLENLREHESRIESQEAENKK